MAGSYAHATNDDGSLRSNESFVQMVENLGDAYETVEEMYGMIWWLANQVEDTWRFGLTPPANVVEDARQHYKEGIKLSPTDRPAQF